MIIGLISDPHANIHALEAVLQDVDRVRPDISVCLGDFVGYGAFPNEVISTLRERCAISLAGNHDLCVLESPLVPIDSLNEVAAEAVLWTRGRLTSASRDFLLSLSSRAELEGFQLAHASPRDPVMEYVIDAVTAYANFEQEDFEAAVVGHTHVPAVFYVANGDVDGGRIVSPEPEATIGLPGSRVILNPGGVGQPRDGDPRASWGILDTISRTFTVRRIEYPVAQAQAAIVELGLPSFLAERLAVGI